jgi:hypothetical protein
VHPTREDAMASFKRITLSAWIAAALVTLATSVCCFWFYPNQYDIIIMYCEVIAILTLIDHRQRLVRNLPRPERTP